MTIVRRFSPFMVLAALLILAATLVTPGTASASHMKHPEVWFGSPFSGRWTSNAWTHHWMGNPTDRGDWAADIAAPAGTPVRVYAAPQRSGYTVRAKVTQIGEACMYGRKGAKFVTVSIYANGTRIGSIKYGHIRPSVSVGQYVNRWGGQIGTLAGGLPYNEYCWTGPHVHIEGFNVHNYSCFNRGYRVGSWLNRTNFVGFVGGRRVSGYRQGCP